MNESALETPPIFPVGAATGNGTAPGTDGFVEINGGTYYCVEHLEQLPTFFLTMVSSGDHWLFAASNGCLSAGRGSQDNALFPYYTVDRIIDNWNSTGPRTVIECRGQRWDPFNPFSTRLQNCTRRIYKSINGDTLLFEERNPGLGLAFRYSWTTSEQFGFIRTGHLANTGDADLELTVVDGLADIMPAGIDVRTQQSLSCLVDAYRLSELDTGTGLLVHRMAASLVDQAVPMECLHATTVWSAGWPESTVLISLDDVDRFLGNPGARFPATARATRGAYFNAGRITLGAGESREWMQVADVRRDQSEVAGLAGMLADPDAACEAVAEDSAAGRRLLARYLAAADGQQLTSEPIVPVHHRANVLFNIMRGGVFAEDYRVEADALERHLLNHRGRLSDAEKDWLHGLPPALSHGELVARAAEAGPDIERICAEYLPLIFSRRHGDPSRPWNKFTIKTRDADGKPVVGFQGNWRDIFQNWEALAWSFPRYNEAFVRKFLNASTADGYNPYRITSNGIEWEEPDESDPWASIGYWGDHQIIYLLKLLEFTEALEPDRLRGLLESDGFVFADVPYEIRDFEELVRDPHHSIHFNEERNRTILERASLEGADGKLLHDAGGALVRARFIEKLLIPLAVKLSNFVPGGGIWMNTQRPEWNDANNALAGNGLSMVTACYLHRYLLFLDKLLDGGPANFDCNGTLVRFIRELGETLGKPADRADADAAARYAAIRELGLAGERYRRRVYAGDLGDREAVRREELRGFVASARGHMSHAIRSARRADALFDSYNILHADGERADASVEKLGPMLEGQVAVLSSGAISGNEALDVLAALRRSPLFCPRRKSYLLYADRELPAFLDYNRVDPQDASEIRMLADMLEGGDSRVVIRSPDGCVRFNPDLRNRFELGERLDAIEAGSDAGKPDPGDRQKVLDLYEQTFSHRAFTGRSGSMFAYEGLGSIYWHMVSKLMLATLEVALDETDDSVFAALADHYYDIQSGLGFRKSAAEYGAFPADAYSHTPAHAGAQQPGLTGMVKEGILCRFGELGVRLRNRRILFRPRLLHRSELLEEAVETTVIRTGGSEDRHALPAGSLLFTVAQTPVVYIRSAEESASVEIDYADGRSERIEGDELTAEASAAILDRRPDIRRVTVHQPEARFLNGTRR